MKVEIDADELCELRKKCNEKNSFVTVILPGGREVKFRGGTTIKADTYEHFLACVGGTVAGCVGWGGEHYNRLARERAWWRRHAIRLSRLIDEREEIIMDSHCFRQKDGWDSHVNSLITYAEHNGYEVPE